MLKCSECGLEKPDNELNRILGIWACIECYPQGAVFSDVKDTNSLKERLSDYPYAEEVSDICDSRIENCGIQFDSELLICNSCLCFSECKKRFVRVGRKIDLFSFEK